MRYGLTNLVLRTDTILTFSIAMDIIYLKVFFNSVAIISIRYHYFFHLLLYIYDVISYLKPK